MNKYDHQRLILAHIHKVHHCINRRRYERAFIVLRRVTAVIKNKRYESIVIDLEIVMLMNWYNKVWENFPYLSKKKKIEVEGNVKRLLETSKV